MSKKIVVIDDDLEIRNIFGILLGREGYELAYFEDGSSFLSNFLKFDPATAGSDIPASLIICDLGLPDMDGLDVLARVKQKFPEIPFLVFTSNVSQEMALKAMSQGAFDYIVKPFNKEQLRISIARALHFEQLQLENRILKDDIKKSQRFGQMIGKSPKMVQLFDLIGRIAPSAGNVLVTGESGTGKELVAKAIHDNSPRAKAPFVPINCGAIPENLLESELFGHGKGAYTGAHQKRRGLFEEANGGTIFLDEIGDMPLHLQVKLLRVIQERKIRPVGENHLIDVDVRILAATHKNMHQMIAEKTFREDLYYRLSVLRLDIPALRDRREDIPILADYFIGRSAAAHSRKVAGIRKSALAKLLNHPWPGNIRELQNTIERAVILSETDWIEDNDLIIESATPNTTSEDFWANAFPSDLTLKQVEQKYIAHVLKRSNGVKEYAAKILGIDRKTLYRKEKDINAAAMAAANPASASVSSISRSHSMN